MSAISETYNRNHNILELEDVLPRCLTKFQSEIPFTSKNGKYELTDELPNDVRLKKISKLHGIKV